MNVALLMIRIVKNPKGVAAIKQVVPYARFLVRASMEKRRAGVAAVAQSA